MVERPASFVASCNQAPKRGSSKPLTATEVSSNNIPKLGSGQLPSHINIPRGSVARRLGLGADSETVERVSGEFDRLALVTTLMCHDVA